MNRPTLNFLIDVVAFIAFAFLTTTGVLSRYMLPPGSGRYATLWGLNRHGWGDLHFWVAVVLLGVLALHLVLHWRWILCIVRGQRTEASGTRVALGAVGLIGLVGLAAAPLLAPVEHSGTPRQASALPPSAMQAPRPMQSREPTEATHGSLSQTQPPPVPSSAQTRESIAPNTEAIRGSMTLRQVAESTGVPIDRLVKQLGLPPGIDADERIGRLRRGYAISPDDVRQVVNEYHARQ